MLRRGMREGMLVVLMAGLVALSCGKSTSTGGKAAGPGRIYLQNDTTHILTVTYYSDTLGEVVTKVPSGQMLDVSHELLPAGTKVTLHVMSTGGDATWDYPSRQDVEVVVEGKMIVRMYGPLRGGYGIDHEIRTEG